jgi:hypothetical protein
MIGSLLPVVFLEAMTSLNEARKATVPGASIEMRSVAVHGAYRLALAMLTVALAKHRGRAQRLVIERYVHRGV